MDELLDKILAESTLFENVKLESYDNFLLALKLADETIINRIIKTNGDWTRARLNKLKKLIDDEILKSYGGVFEAIQNESIESANIAYSLMLGELGVSVPKSVAEDLVNNRRQIQGYEFKDLFEITEENHARQLKVLIASGVSQGRSIDGIISDYQLKSDKLSRGQIRTNLKTVIAESRTVGRTESYKQLEKQGVIKGYEYFATLDSGTTIWCREHDGKKYDSLEDINRDLHTHFNERSVALPLTRNKLENKRASQFGEVGKENYETWFLNQPDWFHQSTLTNKRYEAFLKDKYDVKSLNDINKRKSLNSIKKTTDRIIRESQNNGQN